MSFFKRKEKNAIPPVESTPPLSNGPTAGGYRTAYNPSRDGDLYGNNSYNSQPARAGPPVGGQELDNSRQELFSGYNADTSRPNRFVATSGSGRDYGSEPGPGEDEEEDVEAIKKDIRAVKQDSVNSTRNALRIAREAEETARGTLMRLGDQSEKLANTERHLDVTKNHSLRAADNTDELKKLNRSIFRPAITFNKDAKRTAHEAKIQARYDEEKEERERGMLDMRATQDRVGKAVTYGQNGQDEGLVGGRHRTEGEQNAKKEQRKRFQFEASHSDDELEDEMDENLTEISDMTKRLKALGTSMGQEIESQNSRIDRITSKATDADAQLFKNTEKLKRIK